MKRWFIKDKRKTEKISDEKGAIVIEATLSLTFFMFLIVMLLSIVNICIAQAKIAVALNETAKEISQYSYMYTLTGINEIQAENYEMGEDTRIDVDTMVNSVVDSSNAMKDAFGGDTFDESTWTELEGQLTESQEALEEVVDHISEDPNQWVTGLVRVFGNDAYEGIKGQFVGYLARSLMAKHLTSDSGQSADAYLRHLHVVDGLSGLHMGDTAFFQNGTDDIILVCRYEVAIVNLLDHEYTFEFCQSALTKVWGGKSLLVELEEEETETETELEYPYNLTGEELKAYMIEKYGQGAVDELIAAYGDETENWTYDEWEYYMYLYAASDAPDPSELTGAELEAYMVSEFGQESIDMINEWVDTTGWTYDDWMEFIDAYTSPGADGCLVLGGCFVAGTPVWTEDGLVPIEEISEGTYVLSVDLTTQELSYQKVLHTYQLSSDRIEYVTTQTGDTITTTRTHMFYTRNKGYVPANNLEAGDILFQPAGELLKVSDIEYVPEDIDKIFVYNFEVEQNQNYFVGEDGVLVHNSCVAFDNLQRAQVTDIQYKNGHTASELTGCNADNATKTRVASGEQYTRVNRKKVLKSNIIYESNGYEYETDRYGRIESVSGTLIDDPAKRNAYAQRVAGGDDRLDTDDGGHLIGSQFGGSGNLDNLVPMASATNRSGGKWYTMEQEWAKALDDGKTVDVKIKVIYPENDSTKRPTEFVVSYTITGEKPKTQRIPNK